MALQYNGLNFYWILVLTLGETSILLQNRCQKWIQRAKKPLYTNIYQIRDIFVRRKILLEYMF